MTVVVGYSLADMLEDGSLAGEMKRERFETTLTAVFVAREGALRRGRVPVRRRRVPDRVRRVGGGEERRRHEGVARIDTLSTLGDESDEPTRWLVSLDDEEEG